MVHTTRRNRFLCFADHHHQLSKTDQKINGIPDMENIHLTSYLMALMFLVHGLIMDPLLKDRPIDFFDGEKLLIEGCILLLFIAGIWRFRYFIKRKSINPLPGIIYSTYILQYFLLHYFQIHYSHSHCFHLGHQMLFLF